MQPVLRLEGSIILRNHIATVFCCWVVGHRRRRTKHSELDMIWVWSSCELSVELDIQKVNSENGEFVDREG
jgi:hypothetical protein